METRLFKSYLDNIIDPYNNVERRVIESFFKKELKINDKLPKIYLPKNKIDTFIKWYNEDLRFINDVPKAFQEGYFILENDFMINSRNHLRDILKNEFREIKKENPEQSWDLYKVRMDYQVKHSNLITSYFKFIGEDRIKIIVYLSDGSKLLDSEYVYNDDNDNVKEYSEDDGHYIKASRTNLNREIDLANWYKGIDNYTEYIAEIVRFLAQLFGCTMWYLSTSTNTTKYIYDQTKKQNTNIERVVRNPQKIKTKSTPIYDMSKMREIKVDGLIKRRKGWTYSHSFQVHGHYRHYKNGKTIFIQSYIKGKDKEFQQQNIIISPKE